MNIFYLDNDPKLCAEYHCNSHSVKMILEYCQILSTTHRHLDGKDSILENVESQDLLYKSTHLNHPSTIWTRYSKLNYEWLCKLLVELSKEYTHRYGKIHKCQRIGLIDHLCSNIPKNIKGLPFTEPTPAMPDHCKIQGSSIESYRKYYNLEKQHLLKYKNREIPSWLNIHS